MPGDRCRGTTAAPHDADTRVRASSSQHRHHTVAANLSPPCTCRRGCGCQNLFSTSIPADAKCLVRDFQPRSGLTFVKALAAAGSLTVPVRGCGELSPRRGFESCWEKVFWCCIGLGSNRVVPHPPGVQHSGVRGMDGGVVAGTPAGPAIRLLL